MFIEIIFIFIEEKHSKCQKMKSNNHVLELYLQKNKKIKQLKNKINDLTNENIRLLNEINNLGFDLILHLFTFKTPINYIRTLNE